MQKWKKKEPDGELPDSVFIVSHQLESLTQRSNSLNVKNTTWRCRIAAHTGHTSESKVIISSFHTSTETHWSGHSRDFFIFSIKMIKSIASLKADMFKDYMRYI